MRVLKSLDDEKSGGRNGKQDLKDDQKKFADRDVDEPLVDRDKRKSPTEDHISTEQKHCHSQSGRALAFEMVSFIRGLGAQRKGRPRNRLIEEKVPESLYEAR